MSANCAPPLVADLFFFFMKETSGYLFLTIIKLKLLNSRYLDDLLNIDNPYFKQMVGQIYPTELQLNKANSFDTGVLFRTWTSTCP